MEKITTNSTEKFKDEVNGITVNFRKTTSSNNVMVYAELMKADSQVGSFSYDEKANYMTLSLKPYSDLPAEDVKAIYAKAPEWIDTLIG